MAYLITLTLSSSRITLPAFPIPRAHWQYFSSASRLREVSDEPKMLSRPIDFTTFCASEINSSERMPLSMRPRATLMADQPEDSRLTWDISE